MKDARIEKIEKLLAENGCDCGCPSDSDHFDDCARCLACRIQGVLSEHKNRIRWQCSFCLTGFSTEHHKRICPACGSDGYWSGSVAPDAFPSIRCHDFRLMGSYRCVVCHERPITKIRKDRSNMICKGAP